MTDRRIEKLIKNNNIVSAVFIDLSKALDCTLYNFLVAKIETNELPDRFSIHIVSEGPRMSNTEVFFPNVTHRVLPAKYHGDQF